VSPKDALFWGQKEEVMQQALFAMERGIPASSGQALKASPVIHSALALWRHGKRDEAFGMIENCIDRDASLLYVYAGLKGLLMAEKTLGEALSYLRVATEMRSGDPNLQPSLEGAGQNLLAFNSSLLEAMTTLGVNTPLSYPGMRKR
jgi:hypothetical protein